MGNGETGNEIFDEIDKMVGSGEKIAPAVYQRLMLASQREIFQKLKVFDDFLPWIKAFRAGVISLSVPIALAAIALVWGMVTHSLPWFTP